MAIIRCIDANGFEAKPGYAFFQNTAGSHHAAIVSPGGRVTLNRGVSINVCDMQPPLHVRGESQFPLDRHAWLGWFAELSDERYDAICAEMRRIGQEMPADPGLGSTYDLGPHGIDEGPKDPNDPEETGQHFRASCASFLEHCYQKVGVDLVLAAAVPPVDSRAHLASVLRRTEYEVRFMLRVLGVNPAWPSRILLPAYQMRAFEHGRARLPRQPALTDHPFPCGCEEFYSEAGVTRRQSRGTAQ